MNRNAKLWLTIFVLFVFLFTGTKCKYSFFSSNILFLWLQRQVKMPCNHIFFQFPLQKIEVYKEVLYTITHTIGAGGSNQGAGGGHSAASSGMQPEQPKGNQQQLPLLLKDELYSYARSAFGFDLAQHRQLLSLTAEQKVNNFKQQTFMKLYTEYPKRFILHWT